MILCRACHQKEHGIQQPVPLVIPKPVHVRRPKARRWGSQMTRRQKRKLGKFLGKQRSNEAKLKKIRKQAFHPRSHKSKWSNRGNSSN